MLVLEFLLLSLVGGTVLGVSWRMFDEWRERNQRESVQKSVIQVDTTNRQ